MSIKTFLVYDITTGKILYSGTSGDASVLPEAGQSYLEDVGEVSDTTHYINAGVLTDKPAFGITTVKSAILADQLDQAHFSNIPVGTSVTLEGETFTVNDGVLVFTVDEVGTYPVTFSLYPYKELTINVVSSASP